MPLKDMTVPQMIRITGRWLGKLRPILESTPELSGSLRMLGKAHDGLLSPVISAATPDPLKAVQAESLTTDRIFDRRVRGTVMTFASFAELSQDEETADRYRELSKQLFPLQLNTVNQTYEEEAGTAEALEKKITPEIEAELAALPTPKGRTMLIEVLDIIKLGRRLGELSDKRAAIEQEQSLTQSAEAKRREARLLWIRTVNAFLGIIEIAEISEEEKEQILAPLQRAEEVITRRKHGEDIKDEDAKEEDIKDED